MNARHAASARVTVVPTLAIMAEIYRLPKDGGAQSPRFASYVAQSATTWGLSSYNPMAGAHAAEAVAALLALDAERVAFEAATAAAQRFGVVEPVLLAVVLMSPGMWTDRLANDVERIAAADRVPGKGQMVFWTREPVTVADVAREARAELARVAWTARHGRALTLRAVLEREGMARAIGQGPSPDADEPWGDVAAIVARDGDVTGLDHVAPVLFGDAVAESLGWTPRGLPALAGLRWAAAEAHRAIRAHGAPAVLADRAWLGTASA